MSQLFTAIGLFMSRIHAFISQSFMRQLNLLLMTVFSLGAIGWWWFAESRIEQLLVEQIALRAQVQSQQLSKLEGLIDALQVKDPHKVDAIIHSVASQSDADFITVSDEDGIRFAHPVKDRIGYKVQGDDIDRALFNGDSYLSYSTGSLGPSVRYISPIITPEGKIIGMIKVGYLIDTLGSFTKDKSKPIFFFALGALVIFSLISYFFSYYIRKKMANMEPWQLVRTLKTQQGVLQAAHEGIVAVDQHHIAYLLNQSACSLLAIPDQDNINLPINKLCQPADFFIDHSCNVVDRILTINKQVLIANRVIIKDQQQNIRGAIITLRAHQELSELSYKMTQINQYIEGLRASRHEYANQLSVVSGLLQMGAHQQALELILQQSNQTQLQLDKFVSLSSFEQISALLIGKSFTAKERQINFTITSDSQLTRLPTPLDQTQMCTILGNLLDNSFDAVNNQTNPCVNLYFSQSDKELSIQVWNNGPQIEQTIEQLFKYGFSTKSKHNRGIGLHLIQTYVALAAGHIEVDSDATETTFNLYFPFDATEQEHNRC